MSYVDLMSDVRWTDDMHTAAGERIKGTAVPHSREHIVFRRLFQMLVPMLGAMLPAAPADGSADPYADTRASFAALLPYCEPLAPEEFAEIVAAAAAVVAADQAVTQGRADGDLLWSALDYEEARAALNALPPLPAPDPDTGITPDDTLSPDDRAAVEEKRTELQASLDAFPLATKDLVVQREEERVAQP